MKIGLVTGVFPASEVLMQAETLVGSIVARGTAAVESALHAIRGGLEIPLAEGLAREAELFGQLCASAEKKEAIQAFLRGDEQDWRERTREVGKRQSSMVTASNRMSGNFHIA